MKKGFLIAHSASIAAGIDHTSVPARGPNRYPLAMNGLNASPADWQVRGADRPLSRLHYLSVS